MAKLTDAQKKARAEARAAAVAAAAKEAEVEADNDVTPEEACQRLALELASLDLQLRLVGSSVPHLIKRLARDQIGEELEVSALEIAKEETE